MAEGTYEYECMRAELLGIEKPDYEDFLKKKQEREAAAEEERDTENLKEADLEDESMKHISGGLDELNSILQVTQRKIHRFKASCSSLTSLLKFKIGTSSSSEPLESAAPENPEPIDSQSPPVSVNGTCSTEGGTRKSDLAKALDTHLDRYDAMIEKAENAQYSMAHQNKEMKRFLN
ncbi:hypothetical protein Zmor_017201 [Zophobas morio]|uniref:Uncharacterized protein n=1 Tax=Zophobas morio TaxID=2755281 RepID=A0AA38I8N3_9CUCU|nr:hypothetical protein Zmor_017201 [Zophobas morio]